MTEQATYGIWDPPEWVRRVFRFASYQGQNGNAELQCMASILREFCDAEAGWWWARDGRVFVSTDANVAHRYAVPGAEVKRLPASIPVEQTRPMLARDIWRWAYRRERLAATIVDKVFGPPTPGGHW